MAGVSRGRGSLPAAGRCRLWEEAVSELVQKVERIRELSEGQRPSAGVITRRGEETKSRVSIVMTMHVALGTWGPLQSV